MTKLAMSEDWLREQARRESRVEFHGPRIVLPVTKVRNDLAWYQRIVLRRTTDEKKSA